MLMIFVSAISFAVGLLSGLGLSTLLSLMLWFGFWLAVGAVVVLLADVLMGIGPRVCAVRAQLHVWWLQRWMRKRSHLQVVVPFNA